MNNITGDAPASQIQRSVLFSDLFRAVKRKRVLLDDRGERIYTANLLFESSVNHRIQGQANIHWRLKLRRAEAIYEAFTGFGIDITNCSYPSTLTEHIRGCYSKQLGANVTVDGKFNANFLALLRHAGACMAHYSLTGKLSVDILSKKRHKDTDITVISNADSLSILPLHTLYLPNNLRVYDVGMYNVVYLLGCATNCTIAMDNVLSINGQQKFTVRDGSVAAWARDLHNTIFYLLSLMDVCGAGDMAALALTSGLHSVYTVVGHSDEGGLMRDILRGIAFTPSYGIVPAVPDKHFCHFNVCLMHEPSWDAVSSIWDYVAVATAGLVHISDPCMNINGDSYPTIVTAKGEGAKCSNLLLSRLIDVAPTFFSLYIKNLSVFFATDDRGICGADDAMLTSLLGVLDDQRQQNHLPEGNVIAPWYWVESSGLFSDLTGFESPSTVCGLGPQAIYGATLELHATENAQFIESQGIYDIYTVPWTTARRNPIFTLLNCRKGDGIANIDFTLNPRQDWLLEGQPSRRCCPDPKHGTLGSPCGHQTANRDSLDEYLWGRVSCHLLHPAELTSFNNILIRLKAWVVDEDGDVFTTNMPTREVMEGTVTVKMQGIKLTEATAHMQSIPAIARQYKDAARYLTNVRMFGREGAVDILFGGTRVGATRKMHQKDPGVQRPTNEKIICVSQTIEPMQEISSSRTGNTYRTNLALYKADIIPGQLPEFAGRGAVMEPDTEVPAPSAD
uniref:Putative coat protein n=1 Tax=Blechomonas wendygibsoni Leishmaniavirus-like RNA virus 1 TaxID=2364205 RepID=A0A386ISB5_9VIRU|nr:putative coat protein [Blechomonas wendygibsoni Leishmaniavirus-like RNA virus 1]